MAEPWTNSRMYGLARSGAQKCDLKGVRGATLVTTDELMAMAAVLLVSGALPDPAQLNRMRAAEEAGVTETTNEEEA